MESTSIRVAVISQDAALRKHVAHAIAAASPSAPAPLHLSVEIAVPFRQIGDEWMAHLRTVDPQLLIIDISEDPPLGLRLAEYLGELLPTLRIIGVGPMLPAEKLLAAMRVGFTEYLPIPATQESLLDATRAAARRLQPRVVEGPRAPGQIFSFFSAKGGTGATTIAANLAIHLHRLTGRRTLLVDLDMELGEIAVQLGVEARFNFVDMVRNYYRMDEGLLASYIERHESGVHVLSAPYFPQRPEFVQAEQIAEILTLLRQHYEYVVVDTSKSFSPQTLATMEQSDRIFLVATADVPSLRNIKRFTPVLERSLGNMDERVRLVINRYQEDDLVTKEDVARTVGMPVYWTIANDYTAVMRSINTGRPIVLDGNSDYSRDVRAFAASVVGFAPEPEVTATTPLSRGWAAVRRLTKRRAYPASVAPTISTPPSRMLPSPAGVVLDA
ncbi:MAG TPA: AAA family ATPase [Longimicrobiales bacterium]|nr:AAA family ATPase [Longimicrobiales bacterium]